MSPHAGRGRAAGLAIGLALCLIAGIGATASSRAADELRLGTPANPSDVRVYVLVLDGLRPSEVGPLTPTLSSLRAQGTWYEQARAVLPAETLPNHAAMMTGVLPQRSGIIANHFWMYRGASTFDQHTMQFPNLLGADTLTTRLENRCQVSTATVTSKGYLWGLLRGEPVTEDPDLVDDFDYFEDVPNPDNPGYQREADFNWKPMDGSGYIGKPDDHAIDQSTMNEGIMPWIDSDPPGGDDQGGPPTPQFAFFNLGDIDRAGHVDAGGIVAPEGLSAFRQAALEDTDALLGQFIDRLRTSGAWDETVLIITSDHGMDWSPPDNFLNGFTDIRSVNPSSVLSNAGYQDFHQVSDGGSAMIYDPPAEWSGADDFDLEGMARVLAAEPGVEFVATPYSIPGLDNPTLQEVGIEHPYGGQIAIFAKKGWAIRDSRSLNPLPGNHGHPATQHSVLLVTGGHPALDPVPESVPGETVYDPTARLFSAPAGGPGNLSIAPTVAALLGLGETKGGYDGRPLRAAFHDWAFKAHPPCTTKTRR